MVGFEDLVRTEAYLIWEAEGRPDGQHDRHWQMACERVVERTEAKTEATEAPVVPLRLKRVGLSARPKRKPQAAETETLRASA